MAKDIMEVVNLLILHFVFVVHFEDVVASVVITVVVLSIYKLFTRGR